MILESFHRADWHGANGLVVGRMRHLLGVLATSAMSATSKFENFECELAFVDMQLEPEGECSGNEEGTASRQQATISDRDAEIIKRDAEIIRKFRERCAVAAVLVPGGAIRDRC